MSTPAPPQQPPSIGALEGAALTGVASVSAYILATDPLAAFISPLADAVVKVVAVFGLSFSGFLGYRAFRP